MKKYLFLFVTAVSLAPVSYTHLALSVSVWAKAPMVPPARASITNNFFMLIEF